MVAFRNIGALPCQPVVEKRGEAVGQRLVGDERLELGAHGAAGFLQLARVSLLILPVLPAGQRGLYQRGALAFDAPEARPSVEGKVNLVPVQNAKADDLVS